MRKTRKTLTNRERELIVFAVLGMKSKEISDTMSEFWNNADIHAIDQQYSRIFKKLSVRNRLGLVKRALELGLVTTEGKSVFITELKQII